MHLLVLCYQQRDRNAKIPSGIFGNTTVSFLDPNLFQCGGRCNVISVYRAHERFHSGKMPLGTVSYCVRVPWRNIEANHVCGKICVSACVLCACGHTRGDRGSRGWLCAGPAMGWDRGVGTAPEHHSNLPSAGITQVPTSNDRASMEAGQATRPMVMGSKDGVKWRGWKWMISIPWLESFSDRFQSKAQW